MTAISFITDNGRLSAEFLQDKLEDSQLIDLRGKGLLRNWVDRHFHDYSGHIFIMSLGIVYRMIAGHITNKYQDPAVVVVDDARRYAISALSGHEGGANALTWKVSALVGCEAVISTASDTNRRITMGIGCRRGIGIPAVEKTVMSVLEKHGLSSHDVRVAASVDIKRDEQGLIMAFENMAMPLVFLDSSRIKAFSGFSTPSKAAMKNLGLPGVSEPCALLLGRRAVLIQPRYAADGVTVALAREDEQEDVH
ncbi:MAG: hypothetical protein B6D68_02400 [spirochete symbiont of Stewartia floridana]|nr:MAG: hypothetical protein B6D68_02400 [spirochete symbiont of Stewartia floridana]